VVLILAKITSTSAVGYADYLDGRAQGPEVGDYYLRDGARAEAPGRWAAGGALLGVDPDHKVTGEQLRTLMQVRRPDDGRELRRVGGSGEAVAAIDATFSAPKSVSAVWAIADRQLRERIELAHEAAVDRALFYATGQVAMLRRRNSHGTVVHEKATGLVATSWRHTTARAVADQVPDPQVHSHVLLHAAVRRDGRLVAIDSRSWLVHQREIGAAYRTELARELGALGFTIVRGTGRGGRYFELEEVPQQLLDRWSSRHHQVQAAIRLRLADQKRTLEQVIGRGGPEASEAIEQLELLRSNGQLHPKQERLMGTATRSAKTIVTVKDLDTAWRQTALGLGVSRERLEVLRRQPHQPLEPAEPERVLGALTEFDATFAAREARAVALERSAGASIQQALERLRQLRARREILLLADGSGTTRDHRGREQAVVAITQRLAGMRVEPLLVTAAAREIDRLDRELAAHGGRLSDEQRAAIQLACGEHPLVVIEGQAGTGKSTTLTGVARAHQACGREVIVTSTAGLAAERLARELTEHGIECTGYSAAGLQAAISSGRVPLSAGTTLIHDEAALASTGEQLALLRAVEQSSARLIAVGDHRQNQPVGAGGLWTRIHTASHDGGAHVQLTINQRAHDPHDRHDQARFREGDIELAIRGYAARDRIHIDNDQLRVEDMALDAAHRDASLGKSTIVLAQTSNERLDQLNARAQAIRDQHGELGRDRLEIPGRPYPLHVGDQIQVRHTIPHPERGRLRNGTTATITEIDADARKLELQLADSTRITLDERQIAAGDLRLAYVQHPFPAQGRTTDTAHVIVAAHATREGSYVAITRAREQTHIYATHNPQATGSETQLQQLAEQLGHTERDVPSIDTPLKHETAITATADVSRTAPRAECDQPDIVDSRHAEPPTRTIATNNPIHTLPHPENEHEQPKVEKTPRHLWPGRTGRARALTQHRVERLERDNPPGWEP
jgi:conjugative relaxase-like TrwC/TraI family protein